LTGTGSAAGDCPNCDVFTFAFGLTVIVISCSRSSGASIVDKRDGFGFRVVISVSLFAG
jgi:hypothetical protein